MTADAHRHSIPAGDVALCALPPFAVQPWLSMGVALHAALLERAGMRARVVRPLAPPFDVPETVADASLRTFAFDPPMPARLEAMARAYEAEPAWFDRLVDELLACGAPVVGLSIFRNNVDVSLQIARLAKARDPRVRIVLGGPEAIEDGEALRLPWVDAVVGLDAEATLAPLARALLDGTLPQPQPAPPRPAIDYAALLPLLVGEREPVVPLLLNAGCPYRCGFCTSQNIYGRFEPGSVERALAEMDAIVGGWRDLHGGPPPPLAIQLSDATTNALPDQFDELLRGVIDRLPRWGMRPLLRGQTLFDTRITDQRVRLWDEAGFHNPFFGFDGATDGLRRSLGKPGSVAQVLGAIDVFARSGGKGLTFGVPVGLPGETDEAFKGAEAFVDAVLARAPDVIEITVLPYVFFRSAQDPALVAMNQGDARGVLWRAPVPGGDPAERGRRFMRLFERIDGRVPTSSPVPPYLALPAMLPDEDPARLAAWMDRFGRVFDELSPLADRAARDPATLAAWVQAERLLAGVRPRAGWDRVESVRVAADGEPPALVVLFRRRGGDERAALCLEPLDPTRKAFARTRDYNVSYRVDWCGARLVFDEPLMRHVIDELRRAGG